MILHLTVLMNRKKMQRLKSKHRTRRACFGICARAVVIVVSAAFLTGCGDKLSTQIVLTSDFTENEVFRIEGYPCYVNEIMVYLANGVNQYSKVYGTQIWNAGIGDTTLSNRYKDTVLARIAQIKVMNILAKDYDVSLNTDEKNKVSKAAQEYYESLTTEEISSLNCNLELIEKLYTEFAVADRLYEKITESVNPEISDDEARTISVQTILLKTYEVDDAGNTVQYDAEKKADAYQRILTLKSRIDQGESFEVLAADYNEDEKSEYSFGRGIMPKNFEDAAFALGSGEVSGVIETEYGYHLIRCLSTFDPEQTEENKKVIVEKRRQEAFDRVYEAYLPTLTTNLNQDLWDSVEYDPNTGVSTTSFFDIYNKYL